MKKVLHGGEEEYGAEERHTAATRRSTMGKSYTDEHSSVIIFVTLSAKSPPPSGSFLWTLPFLP